MAVGWNNASIEKPPSPQATWCVPDCKDDVPCRVWKVVCATAGNTQVGTRTVLEKVVAEEKEAAGILRELCLEWQLKGGKQKPTTMAASNSEQSPIQVITNPNFA